MAPVYILYREEGYFVHPDHVEPLDLKRFYHAMLEQARMDLESNIWHVIHTEGQTNPQGVREIVIHRAVTTGFACQNAASDATNDDLYQAILASMLVIPPLPEVIPIPQGANQPVPAPEMPTIEALPLHAFL